VVGKFYPPHRGHQYLISQAAGRCVDVTVLAMAAGCETLPLADRVSWLQAACAGLPAVTVIGVRCDVPVDFGDAAIWAAQVAVMRAALDRNSRPRLDMIFSCEPYGDELAAWFGAENICIDAGRSAVPVSATRIRGRPGWALGRSDQRGPG
jgi:nicotinamide mononucleotide adenylyltransferase